MRTRVRRALCFDSFEAWRDSLLRSGGWEGPKEPDPDTPPLLRVLPSTGGTRQFLLQPKHLQSAATGQYLVAANYEEKTSCSQMRSEHRICDRRSRKPLWRQDIAFAIARSHT